MVKETQLSIDNFIYPIFVSELIDKKQEIRSMPEIYQLDIDSAVQEAIEVDKLGIPDSYFIWNTRKKMQLDHQPMKAMVLFRKQ